MAILINGNGNARVYAAQDADLIASITGNTTVRTSVGNKMAATAVDASTISVADGVIITKEGRRIQLDAGQTDLFTIPTGSAGVTNYYIIGYKLSQNADNVQVAEIFVQLMASSTDTIPEGTFRGGDTDVYVSIARVEQDGINLGTITALLPELETISEINNDLGNKADKERTADITYTSTSNMTGAQILNWIRTNVDFSKITIDSVIIVNIDVFQCCHIQSNMIGFSNVKAAAGSGSALIKSFLTNDTNSTDDRYYDSTAGNVLNVAILSANRPISVYY